MNFNLKHFFSILLGLAVVSMILISSTPQVYAAISGEILRYRTFDGKVEVDVIIRNPPPMVSNTGLIELVYRSGASLTPCDLDLNTDHLDANSSFNKEVTAVCDMGSLASGDYTFFLRRGGTFDTEVITYDKGTQPVNTSKFTGYEVLESGSYTHRLNVTLGRVFFQNLKANVVLNNETAHWQPGARYSCDPKDVPLSWTGDKDVSFNCDFSELPAGEYTVNLTLDDSLTPVPGPGGSIKINLRGVEITNVGSSGTAASPNRFTVDAKRYSSTAPTNFALKIIDPGTGALRDDLPVYNRTYSGVGNFSWVSIDYSTLPEGTYSLALVDLDATGDPILDGKEGDIQINVTKTISTDTCSCQVAVTTYSCTPPPTMIVPPVSNKCIVGKTPVTSCSLGASGSPVTCNCTCGGTSSVDPGGAIVTKYGTGDLSSIFGTIQNVIIGIAVLSGVFIVPYAFVLMSSGNPEKIKQGTDWLKSIFWGYLIIFLAGTLIRIVGTEFLSLGF